MSKQSSVDFILNAFNLLSDADFKAWMLNNYDKIKAMHKEETVDLIVQYEIKHHLIFTEEGILNIVKKAEKYYNETFGGRHE